MTAIHQLTRTLLRSLTKTPEAADIIAERLEELEKVHIKNERLRVALRYIAGESVRHHEHNQVSGKDRLPEGYRTILNLADQALDETS